MSRFVAAAALVAQTASAAELNATRVAEQFEAFKATYGKTYESEEIEAARFNVFSANMERAAELNEDGTAEFGVTKFADLTPQEFKRFLNYVPTMAHNEEDVVVRGVAGGEARGRGRRG
jgi:hypothetical protein